MPLWRRTSQLQVGPSGQDTTRASAPAASSDASPVSPLANAPLVEQSEEQMFAGRDGSEGRAWPAHLRNAFATTPAPAPLYASRIDADLPLKPSERFARPTTDFASLAGQDANMPLMKQQSSQRSVSAGPAAPRPVEKPATLSKQAPPTLPAKKSFFSMGSKKEKSLPPVNRPLAPSPVPPVQSQPQPDAAPRYESRSLPVASSPASHSRVEPALPLFSAAPSSHLASQSMVQANQRSQTPPTHVTTGYTQPSSATAFPSYVPPSGTTSMPRSVSQPLQSIPASSPSSTVPRSQSQSGAYSPMAAFLGTTAPTVSTTSYASPLSRPSDGGGISPASLSDAEPLPSGSNVLTYSPATSLSTPATSDGGHAEPMPKPTMPTTKPEPRTLEDILSRYAPRPMATAPGASTPTASTSSATPSSTAADSSAVTTGYAAPLVSSYMYASSPAILPLAPTKLIDEALANSRSLPQPPSFARTGVMAPASRPIGPRPLLEEEDVPKLQHSTSIQSDTTVIEAEPLPTITPSTSDNFLSGNVSPARQVLPLGAAHARDESTSSQASISRPSDPVAGELQKPAERLANPFATLSSNNIGAPIQRSQVELAQPRPLARGQALTVGTSGLASSSSIPVIEPSPDTEPFAVSSPPLTSVEKPAEPSMTRLSVASREARDRLTNLYTEMNITGRASPAESKLTAATDEQGASPLPTLASSSNSGPSSVDMVQGGSDGDISGFDTSSRISSIDAPRLLICFGNPRFEHAVSKHPRSVLYRFVDMMEWADLRALREVSRALRSAFDVEETREYILERYLGKYGYRTMPSNDYSGNPTIDLSLRDLESFLTGREFAPAEFAELAREHMRKPLDYVTVRMINSAMRAWNRVVMRCRTQGPPFRRASPGVPSIYKDGRAACLRVWVPLRDGHWMQDDEVVQCEKEVWRAGVWSMVQKGDIVWNVAQGDFANEGKLISDSKFLRDLVYTYDHVGHLPPWLNGMTFSPGFWHNILFSSDPNHPVFYTSLAPWLQQLQDSLVLCKENVAANQGTGRYRIQRYVYRAHAELKAGTLIGATGSTSGNGPGGIDCLHQDWAGHLYVETEGSTEHAQELVRRCASTELLPFRVLREKSRPGKIVCRPVFEVEKIA